MVPVTVSAASLWITTCTEMYLLRWWTTKQRVRNLVAPQWEKLHALMWNKWMQEMNMEVTPLWVWNSVDVSRGGIFILWECVRAPAPPSNCFVKTWVSLGALLATGSIIQWYTYANSPLQFCHQISGCRETKLRTVHLGQDLSLYLRGVFPKINYGCKFHPSSMELTTIFS